MSDAGEDGVVIAEVFEAFDGDDAIEMVVGLKMVDVGGDNMDVCESQAASGGFDELSLRMGIGDAGDVRVGEVLSDPKGEGAPAATEFEDSLPVLNFGSLRGEGEHLLFRLVEGGGVWAPKA